VIIRTQAFPRAGLVGNPSDGYFGKTIALAFSNYRAEVILYESPELEILPNTRDHSRFASLTALARDVGLYGYYGGIRLLKATVKRFHDYCRLRGDALHDRNFTIRYHSDIPHLVGLAGSSAIITACLRALMAYYGVRIPKPEQANLILSVERDELGISAGLQDRVIQVYQGVVYMDFDRDYMKQHGHGRYESLDVTMLPPLYIAFRADLSESSEVVHNNLRFRFEQGDPQVLDAMHFWADLTNRVRDCLKARQWNDLPALLNANFDRRASLCTISEGNLRMVQAARSTGASAKFTGSGGAIIGTYRDEAQFTEIKRVLSPLGVDVIQPVLSTPTGESGYDS